MRVRQRLGLLAGIAILAAGSVLLEISLLRTYAAVYGRHVSLLVLPLALLGAGAGAVVLHVVPSLARPRNLFASLGYFAAFTAAATLAALLVSIHVKAPVGFDELGRMTVIAVAVMLPFGSVGMAAAAAFRHARRTPGWVSFALFAGAAFAGPSVVAAVQFGAPRAGILAALFDGLGGLVFYLVARGASGEPPMRPWEPPELNPVPRPHGGVVATVILASVVLLAGDLGSPWLRLPALRFAPFDKPEVRTWTPLGLLTVDKAVGGAAWMRTDGTGGAQILEGKNQPPASADDLPYVLRKGQGPALILGAGGGREVRIAQKHHREQIHVVELDGVAVRTILRDRHKKWSGEVFDKPQVQVTVDDPRGFIRRTSLLFQSVVVPQRDLQTATAVGAAAAWPEGLYTVEALRDALNRLTPDGVLMVSRPEAELDRLLPAAAAALCRAGAPEPSQHAFACGTTHAMSLLLTRAPLTARELGDLRDHCRRNRLAEAFAPDQPRDILFAPCHAGAVLLDPSLPTDDRPFFFHGVATPDLGGALFDLKGLRASRQGLLALVGMLALAAVGLALGVVGPLLVRRTRARERGARLAPLVFFSAAGAALATTGVVLSQRMSMLLGHPGHAFTTVLVGLLGFAAAGGLLAGRVRWRRAQEEAGQQAQMLVILLAGCAVGVGPLVDFALALSIAGRLAVCLALLAPLGMLLGSLPALGLKIVTARAPRLTPWWLGLAALSASVATTLAMLVSLQLGASVALLVASMACLVAAASVPRD